MTNLAWTCWHQECWQEADELLSDAVSLSKKALGLEHLTTLACTEWLAHLHQQRAEQVEEDEANKRVEDEEAVVDSSEQDEDLEDPTQTETTALSAKDGPSTLESNNHEELSLNMAAELSKDRRNEISLKVTTLEAKIKTLDLEDPDTNLDMLSDMTRLSSYYCY